MNTPAKASLITYPVKRWQFGKWRGFNILRILLVIAALLLFIDGQSLFAQGVGISETSINADPSAIFELRSTLRGFLAPRMTTVQRNTLGLMPAATGMLVYDTDTRSFWYYDGGWIALAGGNSILGVGNGGTGLSSGTQGGIPYFNSTSTMASSALLTANGVMIGGGTGQRLRLSWWALQQPFCMAIQAGHSIV